MSRKLRHAERQREVPVPSHVWWGFLTLVLVITAVIRARLLGLPLERDEGEYGYAGQLLLQGVPPYQLAYNMKPPGIYAAYALIMALFGQTPSGIHLGLLLINAATIILVFLLARRLLDPATALLAAGSYALLSVGQSVFGPFAHATHFLVLPALGGILLLLCSIASGRMRGFFASGVMLGVSCLMKQHALFLAGFCAVYLALSQFQRRDRIRSRILLPWVWLGAGLAAPLLFTVLALYIAGTFDKFWFWTIEYAREYVSELTLAQGLEIFPRAFGSVVRPALLLWLLAAGGILVSIRSRALRSARSFLILFTAFSFAAVCPGFYFREHYFIVLLPAVALLGAVFARAAGRWIAGESHELRARIVAVIVLMGAAAVMVYKEGDFLFRWDMTRASRMTYGVNPFPESIVIGEYIKARTMPGDRIAVIGSEPQIYFYTGRRSATGYIYTYGLMEPQPFAARMQAEMIQEIESSNPKFVVLINIFTSWLWRPTSEKRILEWANTYISSHYTLVGVADIVAEDKTEYRWEAEAAAYNPRSESVVAVFKRRTD